MAISLKKKTTTHKPTPSVEGPFGQPPKPKAYAAFRPVGLLTAHPANANTHPAEQIARLVKSIQRFGFTAPILIDEHDVVIAGHGRLEAARICGLAEVPCYVLPHLTDDEKRAYVIADNKLAEGSVWDFEKLKAELAYIQVAGIDMDTLGFSADDFAFLQGASDKAMQLIADGAQPKLPGALLEAFGVAPFTVLNARDARWQARKRAWLSLGIKSEIGRGENLLSFSDTVLGMGDASKAKKHKAIPGGGSGKHSVYMGKAKDGTFKPMGDAEEGEGFAGTSIFDPVLCELAYKWFTKEGSTILDPFAGGSVRGIIAGKLGRRYLGIDLRGEQIEANREQVATLLGGGSHTPTPPSEPNTHKTDDGAVGLVPYGGAGDQPLSSPSTQGNPLAKLGKPKLGKAGGKTGGASGGKAKGGGANAKVGGAGVHLGQGTPPVQYIQGDSFDVLGELVPDSFDFLFSCPPYGDLEVYSDNPADLSNMGFDAFAKAYSLIIGRAVACLRADRFACFVVGDYRDKKTGFYRGLPLLTIAAFEAAGAHYLNEGIFVTPVGSLALRVRKQFLRNRKLGKAHQNVLVFCKGDAGKAAEWAGVPEFGEWGAGSPGGEADEFGEKLTAADIGGQI